MRDTLLLVGSVPLDTPEQVFRSFGPGIGEWLSYIPDGEVGERRYWVDGIAYRVLNGHPEIETIRRPAPTGDGVEEWRPRGGHDTFQFRVRPGVRRVRFGDPGWRLGYTRDAIGSYFVFRQLKKDGVVPEHLRFQVCLPLTYSAIGSYFPEAEELEKVVPGMTSALAAEVSEILRHIPARELAIQWDLAIENRFVEGHLARGDIGAAKTEVRRLALPAAEVCAAIPDEVHVGYHSCFGTLNGWPTRQPKDMRGTVLLLNAMTEATARSVEFLHFPTAGSVDEGYFSPLRDLEAGDARIYVGAIHHLHGSGGMRAQFEVIRSMVPAFGLAAPCGFGRTPERPGRLLTDEGESPPPDIIGTIIADHRAAAGLHRDFLQ